ncbi:N-acylneuraminate cytidylyltransferase [Dyadobacter sp. SG02]|uniref:acylneuraminate cytidylyltransferase family protein n=1 Tax=Dyadobacter sp. SG02 TaxID=1855291 RepID=UPI0008D2F8ED|nr:acylneuraminate cytidylyltransferase family protein [Dyadobacter sp. SG02]SEJ43842.1 N-acylneuraminate cytidylyltransferase [Dyadobacter sp. SG02]
MTTSFPKILGLIPARMGSKGVPGKNMKLLDGIPLIQYTFEAAGQSELLDTILVSTDCPETAFFANCFEKMTAPFLRPAHLATDHSPMIDVLAHALNLAVQGWGDFEYVVLLQPTCPFRAPGIIDATIRHIIQKNADSLITVRKIPDAFNPFWTYALREGRFEKAIDSPDRAPVTRRQDLPPAYYRDGEIYIARTSLIREGVLTGGKTAAWLNENAFGINIDTPADWARAETLLPQWKDQTKSLFSY